MKDLRKITYKEARKIDAEMRKTDDPNTRIYRIVVNGKYVYGMEDLW